MPPSIHPFATAHRADNRTAEEIQRANLSTQGFPAQGFPAQGFPAAQRGLFADRAEIPVWWQSSLEERDTLLSQVKRGEVFTYGTSAGGRPLRAVAYGAPRVGRGTTTANGARGLGDLNAFIGPDHAKRVVLVFAGIHAGEFEGIVAAMNLLAVMETGADLLGRPQPTLAEAAGRVDRLIIIPVVNPDGRARISTRMLPLANSDQALSYINTGAWADGSRIGWPANKEFVPIDFARLQFAGGYFNDAGVNLQHDDFLGQMQPETRALLDLCARERPDLSLNLHTGANWNDYFLALCRSDMASAVEPAWASLYRRVHSALALAGHRSTCDPETESDLALAASFGQNLDTAINFHTGTLCAMVESPSHSFSAKRRDGTPAPTEPLLLLDAHLTLFAAAFNFLRG